MKSTSWHKLNADRPLMNWQKRFWFVANYINNLFPNLNIDPKLSIKKFHVTSNELNWSLFDLKSSPSRLLSDIFWCHLPWREIKQTFSHINILDLGCGRGGYYEKLQKFSGQLLNSYRGLDIEKRPDWDQIKSKHQGVEFHQINGIELTEPLFESINLIISQSVLEHIENDLDNFVQLSKLIENRPMLQIHLFPSPAGLKLYPLHGLREYTPRTISKITRLFPLSKCQLFELGGDKCNQLHYEFITEALAKTGVDRRQSEPSNYQAKVKDAIVYDLNNKSRQPAFYALIIETNLNERFF